MHYKTIIFELLQQRPQMHEQLRKYRILPLALEVYATELRNSHLIWKDILAEEKPGSDPAQIQSEALELALMELRNLMPTESPESAELSLDRAMAFVQRRTPRE